MTGAGVVDHATDWEGDFTHTLKRNSTTSRRNRSARRERTRFLSHDAHDENDAGCDHRGRKRHQEEVD